MSTNALHRPDVAPRASGDLTAARRAAPLTDALTRALASGVQDAEDAAFGLAYSLTLDGATGAWLDVFGAVVGEARGARADVAYRRAIAARLQINASSGERERLITVAQLLTGAVHVQITSAYPAAYTMLLVTQAPLTADELAQVRARIEQATAAGVGAHLVHALAPDVSSVFRLDHSPMPALGDPGDGMPRQF